MGILSECLMMLLLCQALSVLSETDTGAPKAAGGGGDLAALRVFKRSCGQEEMMMGEFDGTKYGYKKCMCLMPMSSTNMDRGVLTCTNDPNKKLIKREDIHGTSDDDLDDEVLANQEIDFDVPELLDQFVEETQERVSKVYKRFLACYDTNGNIVKDGERSTITNTLGSFECTCMDGQWDEPECNAAGGRSRRSHDMSKVYKRFLACYDTNGNIVKDGERGTITNTLGSFECTCMNGQWDEQECNAAGGRNRRSHDMSKVYKRLTPIATCYDTAGNIVEYGKKGTITNTLGSWECTCMEGTWEMEHCNEVRKRRALDTQFQPDDEMRVNFEKRGKNRKQGGKNRKGGKNGKGGNGNRDPSSCSEPKLKQNRNQEQLNKDILLWHNYYRCLHGVSGLSYSRQLQNVAKANVKMNVRNDGMDHSSGNNYGENLWAKWGMGGGFGMKKTTGQEPVKAWYDEMIKPGYKWGSSPTMFSYGTGHFTQVVWKSTTKVGCWTEEHPFQGAWTRVFTACVYDPAGNLNLRPKSKNVQNWNKNVPPPL